MNNGYQDPTDVLQDYPLADSLIDTRTMIRLPKQWATNDAPGDVDTKRRADYEKILLARTPDWHRMTNDDDTLVNTVVSMKTNCLGHHPQPARVWFLPGGP